MTEFHAVGVRSLKCIQHLKLGDPGGLFHAIQHAGGHQIHFIAIGDPGVFEFRVNGDCHVGGNRPGRRSPDHTERFAAIYAIRQKSLIIHQRELNINCVGFFLRVLDFRFRQGGFAARAPVDRFQALINETLFGHFAEHFNLLAFIRSIKRNVGMVPIAGNAKTFEILPLHVQTFQGILTAFPAQIQRIQFVPVQAQNFDGRMLNRQAVRIPTGNIGRIVTLKRLILDNDILQNLVERRADMDVAIGVRRPVMQNEFGPAGGSRLFLVIDLFLLPVFEHLRLPFRQICPHRELRLRQVQCF